MKSSKTMVFILAALLIGACLVTGGCRSAQKPLKPEPGTPQEVATRVETEADKVEGVKKATALVADRNIYVGLDLESNSDKQKSASIEKSVFDRLVNIEPNYDISVTSDSNIVAKIKDVAGNFAEGKPLSDFKNEIQMISNETRKK